MKDHLYLYDFLYNFTIFMLKALLSSYIIYLIIICLKKAGNYKKVHFLVIPCFFIFLFFHMILLYTKM